MTILRLEGVSKTIGGKKLVEGIEMTVEPGEVYGFLGPNGAGKTTTIRMIVGLIKPSSGSIKICGHDIQTARSRALANIGTIVENPETYRYLTGRQNLLHYARLAGIQDIRTRIDEVNEIVRLGDRIDDKVKRYSLGMRQRLGVAQALLARPKLLVLDEPTNGLDPAGMREFRELMRRLADEGMSVFVSSHLLSELELMCDHVGIIKAGRIITEQRMEDLIRGSVRTVSIRVSDVQRGQEVLREENLTAQVQGSHLLVSTEGDAVTAAAVRHLVNRNIDVFSVEPSKDSLEETFLTLTEESLVGGKPSRMEITAGGAKHA